MVPQVHDSAAAASFARLAALCLQHVGPQQDLRGGPTECVSISTCCKQAPVITERRLVPPSTATVPGVGGGGAGQVGGVGLPESTGGQGGVDGLTLPDHSTAEGERRQRCEPVSITAELLLELNPPQDPKLFQFRRCSMQN